MNTDDEDTAEFALVTTEAGSVLSAHDAARFAKIIMANDDGTRPGMMLLAKVVIRLEMPPEDYEAMVDFLATATNHHFHGATCRAISRVLKAQRPQ